MAAYRHGRPQVGWQALAANALLSFDGALGSVTELLSGDFQVPFSRSSHHQVWSQAMVVTPLLRGLLGLEVRDAGRTLLFAPQLPGDWDRVVLHNLAAGGARYDLELRRGSGRLTVSLARKGGAGPGLSRFLGAPAFPQDAHVRGAQVDGRGAKVATRMLGDTQVAEVATDVGARELRLVYRYEPGTEVVVPQALPPRGSRSSGLRVLRSRADRAALHLRLEGLAGHSYPLRLLTRRRPGRAAGVTSRALAPDEWELLVSFEGAPGGAYVRRELELPLQP
jgi:hypothetical protein